MKDLEHCIQELQSGDEARAKAAVACVAQFKKKAISKLSSLLASTDAETRWWAVRTLSEIPDEESKALLIKSLNDGDTSVQQCAALGLRQQPTAKAIPDLLNLLASKDYLLRRLAGDALIAIGEKAVPGLEDILEKGTHPARIEAARALALIGDKHAIPALYKAWQEGSPMIQYWAEEGLNRMGEGMTFFKA